MVRIKRTISFCPDPSEAQPHLVPDHISVSRTRNALAHKTKLGVIMHQFVFAGEYKSLSPLCFRFADHMIQQRSRTAAAAVFRDGIFSGWGLLLFSAIVYLLFGIFLTFNPAKGGSLFVQVMGISLIFAGIENIIFTFYTSKRLKDIRNRLHDEWIALDEDNIID